LWDIVRSAGVPGGKNENGGCEFFQLCNENGWNYWQVQKFGLRLELFKFMGYLICMG